MRFCIPIAALLTLSVIGFAAPRPPLADLGRSVKMRILVDKVMQPTRGWKTEEWMVKEAADAGFNVFSPRQGAADMNAVRQVTEWCRKYGLYHQPWMRGAQDVPADKALSEGKRMVWANGTEQAFWSPNADELWQWMASYIVPYAELSAKDDTLMGVFLDFENYWPNKVDNCYDLSYDDLIMGLFAKSKGVELPPLEFKDRKPWLEERKLHEEFRTFQIAHWREKCRELRQAVDQHNPKFMFNIYPAPGTMFMLEACYPEWATKDAPLILADPWTYGRPGRYATHETALKNNQGILQRGMETAKATGINRIYIGGIDPVVAGADPEFCGKNALMISGLSDGYWIFYEGPTYETTHPDYFKWFTWANRKIEAGDFAAAWQPRETEDPWGFPKIKVTGQPLPRTEKREFPVVKLRGSNALLVAAHKGTPVEINLQVQRIGRNEDPLRWTIRDTAWQDLAHGELAVEALGQIAFAPPADGIDVLVLEAGGNAYAVKEANVPLAIYTDPAARFIWGAQRLYFKAPAGLQQVKLAIQGGGGVETVKLTVFDPAGADVGSVEATQQQNRMELTVPVGDQGGKVWALNIDRASAGVLEDVALTLDKALPQVLSYFPDEVFEVEVKR